MTFPGTQVEREREEMINLLCARVAHEIGVRVVGLAPMVPKEDLRACVKTALDRAIEWPHLTYLSAALTEHRNEPEALLEHLYDFVVHTFICLKADYYAHISGIRDVDGQGELREYRT